MIHDTKNAQICIKYVKRKTDQSIYLSIYMAFTTEGLFEVAIEGCPKWNLNP